MTKGPSGRRKTNHASSEFLPWREQIILNLANLIMAVHVLLAPPIELNFLSLALVMMKKCPPNIFFSTRVCVEVINCFNS